MKLQASETRLGECNRAGDILHHIATDKVRIVFLKRYFMKNGVLRYDKKPRNN
ncbi:hypothetical protein [Oceanobacillus rekensis]|uniref:hypothetical protein n=1 Tax=Oceanobacillus rekensis TaxID=937927 RepID=UPI001593B6E1|nr:hypothetical protein [Oceanobacillus rekensis]